MAEAVAENNKAIEAQGAKPDDLSGSASKIGSAAPAIPSNAPPEKKGDDEVHGAPDPKLEAENKAKAEAARKAEEEAKNKVGEEDEDTPEWDGEYVKLNDPAAESAINLLKEAGVSAKEANLIFAEAIAANDMSKVHWDVLEQKLGKDKARLAKIGIEDYYNRVYSENVKTTEKAYEAVGGEENWQKIAKWVKQTEKADPKRKAEFDEIRKGIDVGGRIALLAVQDLKALYEKHPGNNGLGVGKLTQGDRTVNDSANSPLGRTDYLKAVKEAEAKGDKQAVAALRQRRQAGMAAGLK